MTHESMYGPERESMHEPKRAESKACATVRVKVSSVQRGTLGQTPSLPKLPMFEQRKCKWKCRVCSEALWDKPCRHPDLPCPGS